jgi:hypothetical protein
MDGSLTGKIENKDFLNFIFNADVCSSSVGRQGGRQDVNVNYFGCNTAVRSVLFKYYFLKIKPDPVN